MEVYKLLGRTIFEDEIQNNDHYFEATIFESLSYRVSLFYEDQQLAFSMLCKSQGGLIRKEEIFISPHNNWDISKLRIDKTQELEQANLPMAVYMTGSKVVGPVETIYQSIGKGNDTDIIVIYENEEDIDIQDWKTENADIYITTTTEIENRLNKNMNYIAILYYSPMIALPEWANFVKRCKNQIDIKEVEKNLLLRWRALETTEENINLAQHRAIKKEEQFVMRDIQYLYQLLDNDCIYLITNRPMTEYNSKIGLWKEKYGPPGRRNAKAERISKNEDG